MLREKRRRRLSRPEQSSRSCSSGAVGEIGSAAFRRLPDSPVAGGMAQQRRTELVCELPEGWQLWFRGGLLPGSRARQLLKRYCLSIFVIVLVPPVSVAENVTLSPACKAFSMPLCTLNSSAAPLVPAPTVPLSACLIAIVPLIRSIPVIVPVSACWAKVTELATIRTAEPAKMIFAIFMEISRLSNSLRQAAMTGFVPAQDRKGSLFSTLLYSQR